MASPLASMLATAQGAGLNPTPFRAQVAPTDVEQAYNTYNNAMMQAYSAKVAQNNAMWGGLAGLGGAALLGPLGGSLGSLLGGGTAAATAGGLGSTLPFGIA